MSSKRPPVKIKFRFNLETGTVEQFVVDDNAAGASEEYHDRVALAVGDLLARQIEVKDAGPRYKLSPMGEKLSSKKIAECELDKAAD